MDFLKHIGSGRFIAIALAASLFLTLFASCEAVNGEAEKFQVKEKTLLVYMIANNNLSGNASSNLLDIQKGYIPENEEGNIVVYYHVPNQNPLLLNVVKDGEGKVKVDTSYRFPARNSASKESLKSAMSVTATLFPANEYGLILWSHGTGWLPEGFYENPVEESSSAANSPVQLSAAPAAASDDMQADPYAHMIKMATSENKGAAVRSFGSDAGKEIELKEIVEAMPYKVSFIIFDACLMGGIEVAYELKDSTDYVLFSPAEIFSYGFPYSKIMQHIFAEPADLESVAREYYDLYNGQPSTTRYGTISLVKTSELENVAGAAKAIFDSGREKIAGLNMAGIQRYYRGSKRWFYDLGDFMKAIATEEQFGAFEQALEKAVVYKAATPYFFDISISRYSGLSTYVPNPANGTLAKYYRTLEWNKACGMIGEEVVE